MAHQATSFQSFEEMLHHVDALSFAVPPNVQAEMAIVGALAGKALLLEKPIALDLGQANELARVIDETGVATQLVLTWRYAARVRSFVDAVRQCEPLGGRAQFLTGGFLGGMFATRERAFLALETSPRDYVHKFNDALERLVAPKLVSSGPCKEVIHTGSKVDLTQLPVPIFSERDPAPFITLGLCIRIDRHLRVTRNCV